MQIENAHIKPMRPVCMTDARFETKMVKRFTTICPYRNQSVTVDECLKCQYRDKNHDYNKDGMIWCTYE